MGKGDYLGGSTVVRLNGAYLGIKKPKLAKPTEIAALALYLCSDEAGFITGCDYLIDGGFVKLNN